MLCHWSGRCGGGGGEEGAGGRGGGALLVGLTLCLTFSGRRTNP